VATVVKIAKRGGLRCAICSRGEILHRRVALRGGLTAIAIALLVAGAGCAARPMPALTPGLERYRFEVEIRPSPTGQNMFMGTAEVTDLSNGHTISAPDFILRWGSTARVSSSDPETGVLFQLELAADPEGKGATYFATLKRGEEVLAKNQANAKLVD
jgi:hypothetical protein